MSKNNTNNKFHWRFESHPEGGEIAHLYQDEELCDSVFLAMEKTDIDNITTMRNALKKYKGL